MSNQDHLLYFYMGSHLQHVMKSLGSTTFIRNGSVVLAESLYETSRAATTLVGSDMANSPISGNVRGTPVQQVFTPYGYNRQAVPPLTSTGFTGQPRTSAEPMYLMGNGYRAYITILMRLCSPDALSPLGAGGINAYAYCGNDSINYSDQSGRTRTKNINAPLLRDQLKKIDERRPNPAYDIEFNLVEELMTRKPPPKAGKIDRAGQLDPNAVLELTVDQVKSVFDPFIDSSNEPRIRTTGKRPTLYIELKTLKKKHKNMKTHVTPKEFKLWMKARILDLNTEPFLMEAGLSGDRALEINKALTWQLAWVRKNQ